MNRMLRCVLGVIATVGFTGCMTHVDPGHVGVEVNSCSGGGINLKPLGVGYHSTGACTSIKEYPTYVQTAVWTKSIAEGKPENEEITFSNHDSMQIAADISLAYQLEAEKAPAFYDKFKADDINDWTHHFLRNLARERFDDVAGRYKIDQIMGDNSKFLAEVRDSLQREVAPFGVKILQFGFIGAPRPPQGVIDSINAKIAATQTAIKVENELRQSKAEAAKHVAQAEGEALAAIARAKGLAEATRIQAEAESTANRMVAASLTPILIENKRIHKWDGKLPQVSGSAVPMITLK